MLLRGLLLSLVLFLISSTTGSSPPIVELSNGDTVEGFHAATPSGAGARVFLGVPYARPPLGPLRFREPVALPAESNGNYSCLTYKPSCWQNHSHIDHPITDVSEDCLYVNVFAGYSCQNESKCPVLYYIHGGAFEFDSPSMFPVDLMVENFATHGLVLVTVAYRLGVMGFWSLGGREAVGNYALYDVIEGLRWTQREIHAFGGDRDRVTIMGHSSGSMFVSLLTLSPRTEGLFRAAVMMSGVPSELSTDLSAYHRMAEDVGCARKLDWSSDHKYDEQIVECMRRVPIEILSSTYRGYEDLGEMGLGPPTSHTTPLFDGPDGLFPRSVKEMSKNRRRLDVMIGTTKNELGFDKYDDVNATAASLGDLCKELVGKLGLPKNRHLLSAQCRRHYVKRATDELESNTTKSPPSQFTVWTDTTAELKNDFQYSAPTFREATSLANAGGKVYLYSFDYEKRGLEGVSPWHAFHLVYVVGIHAFDFDDRDYAIKSIYVPLFVNFAKFGDPTPSHKSPPSPPDPEWIPLRTPPMDMNYLSVDLPRARMQRGYHYEGVLFWDYVVPTVGGEGRPPGGSPPRMFTLLETKKNDRAELDEEENPEQEHQQLVDWRKAFWITLFVASLILASLGIAVLVICTRRRRGRRAAPGGGGGCRPWPLRRKQMTEEETLLGSMKHADSYATFY